MLYTDFIKEVLSEAAEIANKNFGKAFGVVKGADNNQVLTETDLEIGKFIIEKIKEDYPEYNIIDEEAGAINNNSKYTWVIDPIDGTSNFANGLPTYGIMLGLLEDDKPIAGGVALPYFSEIYFAAKGKGAFCNGEKIRVSAEKKLLNALVVYGIDGHQEKPEITAREIKILEKIILNIRNLRSSNSVYDEMMVAKGKYGGSLNQTNKIWDLVARQVIIEEAGGIFTDYFGEPIDYAHPLSKTELNFTFCAAPSALHKKLQEIIKKNNNKLD